MSLQEFDIIRRYFKRPPTDESIVRGVGDDCALLAVPAGHQLALSMDTLVAGRHFPENAPPAQIAQRAFCTCLSDLAAMGAQPRWLTLGLTLPAADSEWLAAFSQGLWGLIDHYDCHLVGGDTTQGPLTITLQVHGFVNAGAALVRHGAQVGDSVFVTGTLGDGAAALGVLADQVSLSEADKDYLLRRYYRPEPQIAAGQRLVGYASAAIDISDGLVADLQHIADASGVDIAIDIEKIPLSGACRRAQPEQCLALALTGGDDYQLAFTLPQEHRPQLTQWVQDKMLHAVEIGRVSACSTDRATGPDPKVRCYQGEREYILGQQQGYQHFVTA